MAKNYFKSYIWLLETLQSRGSLTLKELQSLWMKSSVNCDYKELAPRTLFNHIQSIADIFGIDIECNRSDNTYHIANNDVIGAGDVRQWMLETLRLNSILNESAGLKDRIIFENVPSSQKHLMTIIQAIRDGRILDTTYKSYRKTEQEDMVLKPYCLRQFKRRWYLYAHKDGNDEPHVYALDRFLRVELGNAKFKMLKSFNAHDYFSSYYGIRHYPGMKPHLVLMKAYGLQAQYFRSLPLHSSQEEVETGKDYAVFRYYLTPDYDFYQDVLSFGDSVEILEPAALRDEMKARIAALMKRYSSNTDAHGYSVVPINSYEEIEPFGKHTDWCITVDELIFRQYGDGGNNHLYIAVRDDMMTVPAIPGVSAPHDDYGYSLMAIYVKPDGKKSVTSRWNSFDEGDSFIEEAELRELLGEKYDVLR